MSIQILNRKKGKVFKAKYYENGRAITKTFRRKTDASKWLTEEKSKQVRNDIIGVSYNDRIKLNEFCNLWRKRKSRLSAKSRLAYKGVQNKFLAPTLGDKKIKDIKPSHADKFVEHLLGCGLSKVRFNFVIKHVKQVFNDAKKWNYCATSPFQSIEFLKEEIKTIRYWHKHEIEKFLSLNSCDPFIQLYVVVLNSGMRLSEVCGLTFSNLDFGKKRILVNSTRDRNGFNLNHTKSGNKRVIPMNAPCFQALADLEQNRRHPTFVFADLAGNPISYEHFTQRVFYKAIERAGVRKIKFHELRSTFASSWAMSGGNLVALQKILGHSKLEMTMSRYADLSPDYLSGVSETVSFSPKSSTYLAPKNKSGLQVL